MQQAEVDLSDGCIRIRPSGPEDADAIYEAVRESIVELSPRAPWCPPDYSMAHCKPWLQSRAEAWANGNEYDFVIREHTHDAVMFSLIPEDVPSHTSRHDGNT